jgi:Flp pilus assembly protein TadG
VAGVERVRRKRLFDLARAKALPREAFCVASRAAQIEEGSALVEYGIVFVILMTMLLGIADFGRALYSYHFVSHAARDATRWAAVNGETCRSDNSCNGQGYMNHGVATEADVENYVKGITPLGIDVSDVTTTASWPGNGTSTCPANSKEPTCPVQVKVSYNFHFFFSFVSKKTLVLSSTSEMVIAH